MENIPFNVSARTARLIGRENVANANGALVELIKNCYDADATHAIIIFDIKYDRVPDILSCEEYEELVNEWSSLAEYYEKGRKEYTLKERASSNAVILTDFFKSKNGLFIIDNGEGMTRDVIKNKWMVIGTDSKLYDYYTENGRVKVGAKGIGRFALDRLGNSCSLKTQACLDKIPLEWNVKWSDFEEQGKTIEQVHAVLKLLNKTSIMGEVGNILATLNHEIEVDFFTDETFKTGTVINILELRDFWAKRAILSLEQNLKTLIPPDEDNNFSIFIYTTQDVGVNGRILPSSSSDYDYKLSAEYDNEQVTISIKRNELDIDKIDKDLFEMEKMQMFPYDLETFNKGEYTITYSLQELFKTVNLGLNDFNKIGKFKFYLYYMKNSLQNREQYPYKRFDAKIRKEWLKNFGGLKLYRDNFRIRPYGEPGSHAFDWLGLGERVQKNPTGVGRASKSVGSWKVRSNQVSGLVHISRVTNLQFDDKSGREGLQENKTLEVFINLITEIISVFEKDRQYIMVALDELYKSKHNNDEIITAAEEIVNSDKSNSRSENEKIMIEAFKRQREKYEEKLERAISENQLLRGLASTGITMANLAHELTGLKDKIAEQVTSLQVILPAYISPEKANTLSEAYNPYIYLEDLLEVNKRINQWFLFSLEVLKKDKRKSKALNIYDYLRDFKRLWSPALEKRKVILKIPEGNNQQFIKKIYSIDLDSILNNLVINSIYAFENRRDNIYDRDIEIELTQSSEDMMSIIYEDSGPGLEDVIKEPSEIFEAHFTTKKDRNGNPIGTGLGMYIIDLAVKYYNGKISILSPRPGFKIKIDMPLKKREGVQDV